MSFNKNNTAIQRQCVKCKTIKPLDSKYFHKDKNRPLGFMYKCIECERKRIDNRTWEQKKLGMSEASIEKQKVAKERFRKTLIGRACGTLGAYRAKDKIRGYECDLKLEDILAVYDLKCTYCGHGATGYDRKDNSKGHIKSNCLPCCGDCNTAKMDHFTYDEMLIIGSAIKQVKDARLVRLN